jgi:hypothetical protein
MRCRWERPDVGAGRANGGEADMEGGNKGETDTERGRQVRRGGDRYGGGKQGEGGCEGCSCAVAAIAAVATAAVASATPDLLVDWFSMLVTASVIAHLLCSLSHPSLCSAGGWGFCMPRGGGGSGGGQGGLYSPGYASFDGGRVGVPNEGRMGWGWLTLCCLDLSHCSFIPPLPHFLHLLPW